MYIQHPSFNMAVNTNIYSTNKLARFHLVKVRSLVPVDDDGQLIPKLIHLSHHVLQVYLLGCLLI